METQEVLCKCGCGSPPRRGHKYAFGHRSPRYPAKTIDQILLELVICEPAALPTGCWEWPRGKSEGYGRVNLNGHKVMVHRAVYEHFVGPVPTEIDLHHECENRGCANYEHVKPLPPAEHMEAHGGICFQKLAQTHCLRGHPFDEQNTIRRTRPNGRPFRDCRTCYLTRLRTRVRRPKGAA
jgi:hypothetical protein